MKGQIVYDCEKDYNYMPDTTKIEARYTEQSLKTTAKHTELSTRTKN